MTTPRALSGSTISLAGGTSASFEEIITIGVEETEAAGFGASATETEVAANTRIGARIGIGIAWEATIKG